MTATLMLNSAGYATSVFTTAAYRAHRSVPGCAAISFDQWPILRIAADVSRGRPALADRYYGARILIRARRFGVTIPGLDDQSCYLGLA
jgi:hypothetical protein